MTTMTAIEFEKGQAVEVFTEDEWCKGIVTDIDEKSSRPCRVMYSINGISDEAWFGLASIQAR